MDVAVTDVHPLIWAATGQFRKLGSAALAFYERVENGQATLYVPTHGLLEVGEAHAQGISPSGRFRSNSGSAISRIPAGTSRSS